MRNAIILGSALLLSACNFSAGAREPENGGAQARKDFSVGSFDRVAVSGSPDVVVTVGGAPSVRAEGSQKMIDRLDIRVEDGALKIGTRKNNSFMHRGGRLTIYVTAPSLTGAQVLGSGGIRIDKVEGPRFASAIAGSGELDIASLKVGEASFAIAGSGTVRAAGTAQSSNVSVAGSGDAGLERLEARRAKVSVAGSGDVRARAMETAEISIRGSGDVTLSGTAKCTIDKAGSGDARCTG